MPPETENGTAMGAAPVLKSVSVSDLDTPKYTPTRRIIQPVSPGAVLPPGLPADSIIARHFYGVLVVTVEAAE